MRAQHIIPVILSSILGFAFGLIMLQVQKDRRQLEYEVVSSATFPHESSTGRYFVVHFHNSGNTSLDHIEFEIAFDSNVIESLKFDDPSLVSALSQNPSRLSGTIPLLNSDESVSVTITTSAQNEPRPPSVMARTSGATARPAPEGASLGSNLVTFLVFAFGGAVLILAGFLLVASSRTAKVSESISKIENLGEVSRRIEEKEDTFATRLKELQAQSEKQDRDHQERMSKLLEGAEERDRRYRQGEPATQQVIFALMNRAGLGHRFLELATGDDGPSYWRTGLFLLQKFLIDESNRDRYISVMEGIIDVPGVSPASRGFNLYLLAKMEQFRGNSELAIKWFDCCRRDTPLMYEHLMAQDPAYDLETQRQYLKRTIVMPA